MRIIGGKFKGFKIKYPKLNTVRPTKDRIRESVFNLVGNEYIFEKKVLDVFAGSGAYGFEALSRGAKEITFIERNINCIKIIHDNIKRLSDNNNVINIVKKDFFKYIKDIYIKGNVFDLIFCDPPYNQNMAKNSLILISQYDILSTIGLFIIEHYIDEVLPDTLGDFFVLKRKFYKNIIISIYKKNG